MATEGSADFMGPVRPEYSAPTPSFSLSTMPSFVTPAMQNFAAAYTPPPPAPKITFQAPPQVSFPSRLADINAPKRDWSVEVLAPSLTSIKPLVTPPKTFEPSTYVSEKANQQINQATSWAGNKIFSAANSRISQDSEVLDLLKPIIGDPTSMRNSYALNLDEYYQSKYKDRATYLQNLQQVNAYRSEFLPGAPMFVFGSENKFDLDTVYGTDAGKRLSELDKIRARREDDPFFMFSVFQDYKPTVNLNRPLQVVDSPDAYYSGYEDYVASSVTLKTQIPFADQQRLWVENPQNEDSAKFNALNITNPSLHLSYDLSPERLGANVLRHEVGHKAWGTGYDASVTLFGLREGTGREETWRNENAKTYPEFSLAEYGPAVDAIQREALKQSEGTQRITTPQQYQEFMQQYDSLSPEQINMLPVSLEFKRALLYRLYNPSQRRIDRTYEELLPGSLGRVNNQFNFVPQTT